jgi:hypothetical protein
MIATKRGETMELTDKEYDLILNCLKRDSDFDVKKRKALIKKIETRYDNSWILNVNEDISVKGSYDVETGNAVDGYGIIAHLKKGVDYPLLSPIDTNFDEGHNALINNHPNGMEWYSLFLPPGSYTVKNGICEDVQIDNDADRQ